LFYAIYSRINKHAWIQHSLWIEGSLGCTQRRRKQLGTLPIIPGLMNASDRMMMGNRTTKTDDGVTSSSLQCLPLLHFTAAFTSAKEGKIRRWSVWIHRGEPA